MREKQKIAQASIYKRGAHLIIHPCSRTTAGVYLTSTPVIVIPDTVTDEELWEAVSDALRRYRYSVPHPDPSEMSRRPDPLMEAVGVKSWASFSRNSVYCSISEESSELRFTPSRKIGSRGAYESTPDREVVMALPSTPRQIGAGIREALSRCE